MKISQLRADLVAGSMSHRTWQNIINTQVLSLIGFIHYISYLSIAETSIAIQRLKIDLRTIRYLESHTMSMTEVTKKRAATLAKIK